MRHPSDVDLRLVTKSSKVASQGRHMPDLFWTRLSAFAGPTIGKRRTFFGEGMLRDRSLKPGIGTHRIAYKAYYKAISV